MTKKISFITILAAHDAEIAKRGAQAHNYGWAVSDDGIVSKTDKGILSTDVVSGGIIHTWTH